MAPERDLAQEEHEEAGPDFLVLVPDGVCAQRENERGAARANGVRDCSTSEYSDVTPEPGALTLRDPGDAHAVDFLDSVQVHRKGEDVQDHAYPAQEVQRL